MIFSGRQQYDLLERGYSRRQFARIASFFASGAVSIPLGTEYSYAQRRKDLPKDAVKLNANENPLGPCAEAIEAIHNVIKLGGHYHNELTDEFAATLAAQSGLPPDHVVPYPGSSMPLHQSVLAFCSPKRPWIHAEPGYEAAPVAAQFIGAKVIAVPLVPKIYAHDVKTMAKAAALSNAGAIYVCNPNNPTGTLTPDVDITWLADNMPKDCVMVLDEAYIHIAGAPMRVDLVKSGKNIVILRTFSKIYGMAGLRAGAAIGRPDLMYKIRGWTFGPMPITGMVGATASLKSKDVVPVRRKIIADTRRDVLAFLAQKGYTTTPSVSNNFMLDVRRPSATFAAALAREKVYIANRWPVWPTQVRVSIGTPEEMDKFKAAFVKVMKS